MNTQQRLSLGLILAALALPLRAADIDDAVRLQKAGEPAQAAAIWKKAADRGDAIAQTEIGLMLTSGGLIETDDASGIQYLAKAAAQGYLPARTILAAIHLSDSARPDKSPALQIIRRNAEAGEALAQVFLGGLHQEGEHVPRDAALMLQWFTKGTADRKLPASHINFARLLREKQLRATDTVTWMSLRGDMLPKDYRTALVWIAKSAALGDASKAVDALEELYRTSESLAEREAALTLLEKLAGQGSDEAAARLGDFWFVDAGRKPDYARAAEWYRRSAALPHSQAQLGRMYHEGLGVPQDARQAFRYTELAAKEREVQAVIRLGDFYRDGVGVEKNLEKALAQYQRSHDPKAKLRLGDMFANGWGVKADLQKAEKLYWEAMSGQAAAFGALDAIAPQLVQAESARSGKPFDAELNAYRRYHEDQLMAQLSAMTDFANVKESCRWLEAGLTGTRPADKRWMAIYLKGLHTCVQKQGYVPSPEGSRAMEQAATALGNRNGALYAALRKLDDFDESEYPFSHRDRAARLLPILNVLREAGPGFARTSPSGREDGMFFDKLTLGCREEFRKSVGNAPDTLRACVAGESKRLETIRAETAFSAWALLTPREKEQVRVNLAQVIAKHQVWLRNTESERESIMAQWDREARAEQLEQRRSEEFSRAMREAGEKADRQAAAERRQFWADLNAAVQEGFRRTNEMHRAYQQSLMPRGSSYYGNPSGSSSAPADDDDAPSETASTKGKSDQRTSGQSPQAAAGKTGGTNSDAGKKGAGNVSASASRTGGTASGNSSAKSGSGTESGTASLSGPRPAKESAKSGQSSGLTLTRTDDTAEREWREKQLRDAEENRKRDEAIMARHKAELKELIDKPIREGAQKRAEYCARSPECCADRPGGPRPGCGVSR